MVLPVLIVSFLLTVTAVLLGLRADEEFTAMFAAAAFLYGVTGALISLRRPGNSIGLMFLGIGLAIPLSGAGEGYVKLGDVPGREWVAWAASLSFPFVFGSILIFLPLLFPTGRLLSARWKWVGIVGGLMMGLATAAFAFGPGRLDCCNIENPVGIAGLRGFTDAFLSFGFLGLAILALVAFASVFARFRRSQGEERLQMKWFVFAVGLMALVSLMGGLSGPLGLEGNDLVPILAFPVAVASLPMATGIAILRYRLYDIDVVINKTFVYFSLAAFITLIYVGVVVGVGSIVGAGGEPNLGLSLAATGLVAVAFQPVRERIQSIANRLVYGQRLSPYEAVTNFSHRMAESLSFNEVLPSVAQAAANAVGGSRAAATLIFPAGGAEKVFWPPTGTDNTQNSFDATVEVIHQGTRVGEIAVAKKKGEALSPQEHKLLSDLASQAGLAFSNLRLTEELKAKLVELQESRRRIVSAQDEERRRMERDIHDGAQQQLVSMSVKLGLTKSLLTKDPTKAQAMLEELKAETSEAVETLRDLARGLYPPVLEEQGLVAALRAHINKMGLNATVEATQLNGARMDRSVEAAVYFVVREALQNASKHAPGSDISVEINRRNGDLTFEVKDRGPGFDPSTSKLGSGLQNMSDRVAALDGIFEVESVSGNGTTIRGVIPVSKAAR